MSTAMVAERMESTKEMNGEPINFRCSGMHKFCLTMIAGSRSCYRAFFFFFYVETVFLKSAY